MIQISNSALQYAANICEELPNYRATIIVEHYQDAIPMADSILKMTSDNSVVSTALSSTAEIKFSNGSKLLVATDNCEFLGWETHLLIFDKAISKETIKQVYEPFLVDYYKNEAETEEE